MDWQLDVDEARKRIKELEKEVDALKKRMDNQYKATEDLIRRVTTVEAKVTRLHGGA
jgi:hypothetical protein